MADVALPRFFFSCTAMRTCMCGTPRRLTIAGREEGSWLPDVSQIYRVVCRHDACETAVGARLLVRSTISWRLPDAEILRRHALPQVHRDRFDASLRDAS